MQQLLQMYRLRRELGGGESRSENEITARVFRADSAQFGSVAVKIATNGEEAALAYEIAMFHKLPSYGGLSTSRSRETIGRDYRRRPRRRWCVNPPKRYGGRPFARKHGASRPSHEYLFGENRVSV